MSFEDVGALLRSEREKRHLSIDDIANQLKISPRQLRALEDGQIDSLPHPSYAKGFIRSYANWLGIGNDEIQKILTQPAQLGDGSDADLEMDNPHSRKGSPRAAFIFLLLCAAVGGGYYLWQSGWLNQFLPANETIVVENLPSADAYMAEKDAQDNKTVTQASVMSEQEVKVEQKAPEPVTPEKPKTEPEPVKPAIQEKPAPAEAVSVTPIPVASATNAKQQSAPSQHKLIITAIEECWVHSNADKSDTRQFSLRKGDTFALTFGDTLEVKLGNAGGVRLRYDGNDLPPAGTSGQVKTIMFPPKTDS